MILLDTDHISILQHADSDAAQALRRRLKQSSDPSIGTTTITLEEQSRSWLGLINRYSDARQQVTYYDRFVDMFRFFAEWRVIRFDSPAAAMFQDLRSQRIRIGTPDLKIAAICKSNNARIVIEKSA